MNRVKTETKGETFVIFLHELPNSAQHGTVEIILKISEIFHDQIVFEV